MRPHGVRGELLLETLTNFPNPLDQVEMVYMGDQTAPHPLRSARPHRGHWLIRLADCLDRDAAETFRGQLVQVRVQRAVPLPSGRYYQHQIIGLGVMTDEGESLGEVMDILETGANDVYVVKGAQGEILLPAISSVIRQIDLGAKCITVHLLEGLR